MGEGSSINMLGIWQQTEDMVAKRAELAIRRERLVTELEQLTGTSDETWVDSGSIGGRSPGVVDHACRSGGTGRVIWSCQNFPVSP